MILTYNDLVALVEACHMENVSPEQINGASIDLTLGDIFWIEDSGSAGVVDLAAKGAPSMVRHDGPLFLYPGQFCLAGTREIFHLPSDVAGHYMLKSSLARSGLGHLFAGFCDPCWHGSALTLEFKNELEHHALKLTPGMKCGQIVFFRGTSHVPHEASYAVRGQYNNDSAAQPSKGAR